MAFSEAFNQKVFCFFNAFYYNCQRDVWELLASLQF